MISDGKEGKINPREKTNASKSKRENGVKKRTQEGLVSYVTKGERSYY